MKIPEIEIVFKKLKHELFSHLQQMEEQFKTLIVLSHYLEVWTRGVHNMLYAWNFLDKLFLSPLFTADGKIPWVLGWGSKEPQYSWSGSR